MKKNALISSGKAARWLQLLLVTACAAALCACGTKAAPATPAPAPSAPAAASAAQPLPLPQSVLALQRAKQNNADTVAWLCLPGTDINDPVLQSTDNEHYLHRDENGVYNAWGCYFADYYSVFSGRDNLRQNTVIYGHSESSEDENGQRFTQLFRYLDADFLVENHDLALTVGEEVLTFEICAVFFTDIDFYYINPSPSDEGFADFSDAVAAKNEYSFASGALTESDRLLTLSTCAYRYDTARTGDQRLVVMARLIDDAAQRPAFSATANPAPQRP